MDARMSSSGDHHEPSGLINDDDRRFVCSLLTGASSEAPLHVMGPRRPGYAAREGLVYHHCSAPLPRAALVRVGHDMYVASPELVFIQMARQCSYGALLALGFELCGCYPLDRSARNATEAPSAPGVPGVPGMPGVLGVPGAAVVRHPLSSPGRLLAFAAQARGIHGVKKAREVARRVLAKSASPRESEMAILVSAPRYRGGFGITDVALNEKITFGASVEKVARRSDVVADLSFRGGELVLEYDGLDAHTTRDALVSDSRRRDAMAARGATVRTVTGSQFDSIFEFQQLIRQAFAEVGKRVSPLSPQELQAHMALRTELRHAHRRLSIGMSRT